MRYLIVAVVILAMAGCNSTKGPGINCDPTAIARNADSPGAQAAAAAAAGGQHANNAPFADDTGRLASKVTTGAGAGATSSSSADTESRHVASGGAQNLGVVLPTQADAQTGGSGVSVAVAEAAKSVAAARAAWVAASCDPTTTLETLKYLSAELRAAQEALGAASASSTTQHVTNNNFQGATITQLGLSSSSTDGRLDPESVKAAADNAAKLGAALGGRSTSPSAPGEFPEPAAPAAPETPPAGPSPAPTGGP